MIEKINENSDLVGGSSEQDKLGIRLLSYSSKKEKKIVKVYNWWLDLLSTEVFITAVKKQWTLEFMVESGEQNKLRLETKEAKVSSKILLVKSSGNNFIFLPVFYLIMSWKRQNFLKKQTFWKYESWFP